MTQSQDEQQKTPWGLVLLIWAAGLCAAGQFAKFSVAFSYVQQVYPDAGAATGFLVSLLSFMGIALGLFAGLVVSRIGFRNILVGSLLLGAVMSLLQIMLPPLSIMLFTRVIEGMSHLGIVVAGPTLMAQLAAPKNRPMVMTLWGTFFGVSFALFAFLGLPLLPQIGLQGLFLAHGLAMIVLAAVLFWRLPTLIKTVPDVSLPSWGEVMRLHKQIYASPYMAAPALGWLFYTLTFVAALTLLPSFAAPDAQGFVAGALPLASMVSSMTLGLFLLRWMSAVRVLQIGFVLAAIMIIAWGFTPGDTTISILFFCGLGLVQGASFASVPELNHDAIAQARTNGAMAQMGNLGNTIGTPILLGAIALGGTWALVGVIVLCHMLGLAVHLVLQRRRESIQAV